MRRLALLVTIAGCATSYENAVRTRTIGPGTYLISADGNGYTSRTDIIEYTYRRAAELCQYGFDVVGADASSVHRTNPISFDGGETYVRQEYDLPSGSLAVRCRPGPPAPRVLVHPGDP